MKKGLLQVIFVCCMLALFPAAVSAADGYAIEDVTIEGASVRVVVTTSADCTLFVGLYEQNGKMTAAQSQPLHVGTAVDFVDFNDEISTNLSARAFLLDSATCAPLCDPGEQLDQYALIERITIKSRSGSYVSSSMDGNAPLDVQAVIRTASGVRENVMLDDSRNYRNPYNNTANDETAIAPAFRAGRIVRFTTRQDKAGYNIYTLHAVDDRYTLLGVPNFTISGQDTWQHTKRFGAASPIFVDDDSGGTKRLTVAPQTHFTVQNMFNNTYTSYIGTKNLPKWDLSVDGLYGTAYIYHRGAIAKLIFITNAANGYSNS